MMDINVSACVHVYPEAKITVEYKEATDDIREPYYILRFEGRSAAVIFLAPADLQRLREALLNCALRGKQEQSTD